MARDIVFDQSGNNFNIHLSRAAVQELQSAPSDFNRGLAAAAEQFPDIEKVIGTIEWGLRGAASGIISTSNGDQTGRVRVAGTLPKGQITAWSSDD
ncbi:hypothetical protein [Streptomyces sp. BA2]|uniref:hypothetical protein n=1 Tax=Streptomyces sp. BA2 TaxID=436595 RepID=UPI001320E64D|nr:hypothetical protein [Streptomyces sp. BA2]MWA07727.1 hypothetical protein [Streptomyces sp. BA2]